MTLKQMCRMMWKHGISLVYHEGDGLWYAGKCDGKTLEFRFNPLNLADENRIHASRSMEGAVEDYCAARNLRWED